MDKLERVATGVVVEAKRLLNGRRGVFVSGAAIVERRDSIVEVGVNELDRYILRRPNALIRCCNKRIASSLFVAISSKRFGKKSNAPASNASSVALYRPSQAFQYPS